MPDPMNIPQEINEELPVYKRVVILATRDAIILNFEDGLRIAVSHTLAKNMAAQLPKMVEIGENPAAMLKYFQPVENDKPIIH